jgi:cytochrome oxidase Cu insertion factor (SCO1/SenC/PrrC family)
VPETIEARWYDDSVAATSTSEPDSAAVAPSADDGPPSRRRSLFESPFVWAALAGLVLIPLMRPMLRFEPEPPPVIATLPAFHLADQDGNAFGNAQLGGAVHVVGFVFTRCTTVCPLVTAGLHKLARRLDASNEKGVELLLVTVDPAHDTPEVLRDFARRHGLDRSRFTLVTGDEAAVRRLVVEGFLVGMGEIEEPAAGMIEIAHTGRLALLDGAGGLRGFYDISEEGLDEVYHRARTVLRRGGGARG